jgi:hypothetical protein
MINLKHVGRLKNNKRRVIVAYRTIPNDPFNSLVVFTDALPADEHDALISLVESAAGQEAYELAEAMARARLPDGRVMLSGFHMTGRLFKIPTSDIEMTPNTNTSITLDKLNEVIAQQRNVTVHDLALRPDGSQPPVGVPGQRQAAAEAQRSSQTANPADVYAAQPTAVEPLSDEDVARKLRGQADALYKEAKRLRDEAENLSPIKKKSAPKIEE